MFNRPHRLKVALLAAVAGISLVAGAGPAAARTVCNGYGQCWYVRDTRDYNDAYHRDPYYWNRYNGNYNGSYNSSYYDYNRHGTWRWVCDRDGDDCRWVLYRDYDQNRYWGY